MECSKTSVWGLRGVQQVIRYYNLVHAYYGFHGSMSLCPGFIASRVLCVCNFYATFFCNFLQVCCNFFFATFWPSFLATKSCKKNAKRVAKKCNLFLQFLGGGEVAKSCKKNVAKSCISCKHIEPGTQWTRDTKTCNRFPQRAQQKLKGSREENPPQKTNNTERPNCLPRVNVRSWKHMSARKHPTTIGIN